MMGFDVAGVRFAKLLNEAPFLAMNANAEHHGFLQKIKDKLHIGGHHKSQEEEGVPSQVATDSAAVSSTPAPPAKAEPVVAKPVEAAAPAAAPSDVQAEEQHQPYAAQPTTDLNSLAGHEAEHHGGVPTFLVALPDQDIPDEVTKDTATSDPDEVTNGEDATAAGPTEEQQQYHAAQDKELDSEELFSNAQQGEHHDGVPTFLVALPDQEIPEEVNKGVAESETAVGATSAQVE